MDNIVHSQLQTIINGGVAKAAQGMEALYREYRLRRDYRVKPEAMDVEIRTVAGERQIRPIFDVPGEGRRSFGLTGFSRGQLLSRAGIPHAYAKTMLEHDPDLLRFSVQRLTPKLSLDSLLVRTVGDTAKGVLSASYRPLDAAPIFEAYVEQSMGLGLVPYRGDVSDTRAFLSFIQTEPVELFPGEWVVLGSELRTSDYGNGALALSIALLRLLCVNGMTGLSLFSKVHLGRRFGGEDFGKETALAISSKTIDLDTATVQSALADAVKGTRAAGEALVAKLRANIAPGETGRYAVDSAIETMRKAGFRKDVLDEARALYENTALPVEAVPEAPGPWRMANVLSLLANKRQGDEAADLRDAAFRLLAS